MAQRWFQIGVLPVKQKRGQVPEALLRIVCEEVLRIAMILRKDQGDFRKKARSAVAEFRLEKSTGSVLLDMRGCGATG
jgi:hypothetical protein